MKSLKDAFKYFRKSENSIRISEKDYLKINSEFNRFLIQKVLEGEEISLPSKVGHISIVGKKQNLRFGENGEVEGLAPDWRRTKILWESNEEAKKEKKLVYCTNEHSDGVRYKFFWSKGRVLITNKTLYSLTFTRENKRAINSLVVNFNKEYKNI